ncbi:MAG: PPC domain-containing protein [bacterium]
MVEDGLIACSLDRDWYSFQTARGYGARVTVRFRHANGDLDLRVYPPEGDARASQSQTDDEVVTIDQVAAAGTWYVEVYARGLDANDYQLEVELLPPAAAPPMPPRRPATTRRARPPPSRSPASRTWSPSATAPPAATTPTGTACPWAPATACASS